MNYFTYFPKKKLKKIFVIIIAILFLYILLNNLQTNFSSVVNVSLETSLQKPNNNSKIAQAQLNFDVLLNVTNIKINYNIHIFYYAWYANIAVDKFWKHWDHRRLTHWNKALEDDFDKSRHLPPEDIGADFYPALGLYSSRDKAVRHTQLRMIRYTGVGVIIFSWYPGNMSDPNGGPVDDIVDDMLDDAHIYGLKVALHIEPYKDRSVLTTKKDLLHIYTRYSHHPAYFKRPKLGQNKPLPVVFIYDSYLMPGSDWYKILGRNQPLTIRKTREDFFVVGLDIERDSCRQLSSAGFDAMYTYFVSEKSSFGSSSDNWKYISEECAKRNIDFFPSIGPGYKDISVRPWNSIAIHDRDEGKFYRDNFLHVKSLNVSSFGITSFNEWHEGTQIEPAVPHTNGDYRYKYDDYLPHSPMFYLDITRAMVDSFTRNTTFHL